MLMSKQQILEQRLRFERVKIPWIEGGEVMVRALPTHVSGIMAEMKPADFPDAFVFVNAVVDEKGNRLYSDDEAKQVAESVQTELVQLVVAAAFRISAVPKDRQEHIKKNWQTPGAEAFGESPSPSDTHTPT